MKVIIEPSDISEAQRIAEEYFLLTIDSETMKKIIESSKGVQSELLYGSLQDTAARDYLIDAIVDFLLPEESKIHGRWQWPCNGDSDEYKSAFYHELMNACKANDIVFAGQIQ